MFNRSWFRMRALWIRTTTTSPRLTHTASSSFPFTTSPATVPLRGVVSPCAHLVHNWHGKSIIASITTWSPLRSFASSSFLCQATGTIFVSPRRSHCPPRLGERNFLPAIEFWPLVLSFSFYRWQVPAATSVCQSSRFHSADVSRISRM